MKLLICDQCHDVFNLSYELRRCSCGHTKGKYDTNGSTAVVNGNGYSLAIGNGDLVRVIRALREMEQHNETADKDRAFFNSPDSPTRLRYAWVRPHDGPGNPHTRIDKDLR